ncbi:helix-turn-helix transcriptional regulator [Dickeya solani]|uniref:AlpA family transcriptional regulator n=1 Tax=Dickeya solani TaxID=1089444 RepID=A0ABU4EBZ7_9GAMM|nr:AlpA family transcriptional regulator [Dickeya solani]MCA6998173.1 AlpA family transcriptional regulator [Dickeya solani]MDV6995471.1 AlpA family transcriptional regulator [Dickeya solani]MDV7003085.1 AlpA family transcriptional regulator [Dickeya solani]MDV7037951.1 AlpA family transcriptional regulator [Dickeya solani]MDV7041558.1 AlpA family transcriptional regulator [Dickeya solani]
MNLISKKEVMEKFHIKSRDTLYRYEKNRGFPRPIKKHPTYYLKSAVEDWALRQSENFTSRS